MSKLHTFRCYFITNIHTYLIFDILVACDYQILIIICMKRELLLGHIRKQLMQILQKRRCSCIQKLHQDVFKFLHQAAKVASISRKNFVLDPTLCMRYRVLLQFHINIPFIVVTLFICIRLLSRIVLFTCRKDKMTISNVCTHSPIINSIICFVTR